MQIRDILKKVGPDTHQPLLDNILSHMGQMYSALGKPAEAVPMLEDSLEIQENIMGEVITQILYHVFLMHICLTWGP